MDANEFAHTAENVNIASTKSIVEEIFILKMKFTCDLNAMAAPVIAIDINNDTSIDNGVVRFDASHDRKRNNFCCFQ